jgi:curli production assembly/transport component CsgG/holdfast attachment protein HfaB
MSTLKVSAVVMALLMGGCATTPASLEPVAPIKGSPSEEVDTDYSPALECLASYARSQAYPAPRVAIGHIMDLTGAQDSFLGKRLTQGATLMAITAVSKAGMRVVERFDMGVVQVELDYANKGLVRDAPTRLRDNVQGQIEGTDLYLVGGITEFNPNIRSSGGNLYIGGNGSADAAAALSKSSYVFDVGLDLRLIDVKSTEVIAVKSLRKQLRGYEYEAGVFGFMSNSLIDAGGGARGIEPTQSAVRNMIERAVFEFMSNLYNLSEGSCLTKAPTERAAAIVEEPSSSSAPADGAVQPPAAQSSGPLAPPIGDQGGPTVAKAPVAIRGRSLS